MGLVVATVPVVDLIANRFKAQCAGVFPALDVFALGAAASIEQAGMGEFRATLDCDNYRRGSAFVAIGAAHRKTASFRSCCVFVEKAKIAISRET